MLRGCFSISFKKLVLILVVFTLSREAYADCAEKLRSELPALPAHKDVDLYKPMRGYRGIRDSVVAAIVHQGKLLMLQRGAEIGRGYWGLAGGKLDKGESLAETLGREVWEEVGLQKVGNLSLLHVHYHVVPESKKIFRVFVIRAEYDPSEIPNIKEPDKILDMGWYPIEELPQPLFANFDFYKDLLNEISDDMN